MLSNGGDTHSKVVHLDRLFCGCSLTQEAGAFAVLRDCSMVCDGRRGIHVAGAASSITAQSGDKPLRA
jgi:hypothetical protein